MGSRIPVPAHESAVEIVQALSADRVFVEPGRLDEPDWCSISFKRE